MKLTKQKELLLSPGEWATVGAVHEAASLEFEALSKAVDDVLSGRARSLHVALRGAAEATGAEQVSRAAHNWAVHEVQAFGLAGAELIAADPIEVLQGVLIALAELHHAAHQRCNIQAAARKRGGRPPGAKDPVRKGKKPGIKFELGMTGEILHAWAANRLAAGAQDDELVGLRKLALQWLRDKGKAPLETEADRLARNWARHLRKVRRSAVG